MVAEICSDQNTEIEQAPQTTSGSGSGRGVETFCVALLVSNDEDHASREPNTTFRIGNEYQAELPTIDGEPSCELYVRYMDKGIKARLSQNFFMPMLVVWIIQPDIVKKLTVGQYPKHHWEVPKDVSNSVIAMDNEVGPSFVIYTAEFVIDIKKAETLYVEEYSNSSNGFDTSEVGADLGDRISAQLIPFIREPQSVVVLWIRQFPLTLVVSNVWKLPGGS